MQDTNRAFFDTHRGERECLRFISRGAWSDHEKSVVSHEISIRLVSLVMYCTDFAAKFLDAGCGMPNY